MLKKEVLIKKILRWFAGRILQKYKPIIIGVTGSVGKSTTKEMIFAVLENDFQVRKSEKNYNNEVGIPLTIIGGSGEKKNVWQWLKILGKSMALIVLPNRYPEILVLELAADRVGDIKYFCDFIPVDIGVLTNVGISHLEKFKTKENIFREKSYLLKRAKELAIFNGDSVEESEIGKVAKGELQSYGFGEQVDWRIIDSQYNYTTKGLLKGIKFKLKHQGKVIPGHLENVVGRPYLCGMMPALIIADHFKLNLLDVLQDLESFVAIPGHLSLITGIKNTVIVDDTYNSAPASVEEALKVVKKIKAGRKIVVLGDMLELGKEEKKAHQKVGEQVGGLERVVFVAVGKRMKLARESFKVKLQENGIGELELSSRSKWFANSEQAGDFLEDYIQSGDVILIKGSQGMRMEKIVVRLMKEKERREELVVRQGKEWLTKHPH